MKVYNFTNEKDVILKRRENRNLIIDYKIIAHEVYPDDQNQFCVFLARSHKDFTVWMLMYDIKIHKIIHKCQLPNYYTPITMCFNENRDRILVIASRKGEQDLNPTDEEDLSTVMFQDHMVYYINVEKFKVKMDGKLTKHMHISLAKIKPLGKKINKFPIMKNILQISKFKNRLNSPRRLPY